MSTHLGFLYLVVFSAMVTFLPLAAPAASPAGALALQERMVEIFADNKDAIVRVKAAYTVAEGVGKQQVILKVGTGFFISREGHIMVSASRAVGADRVWVEYQGRSYEVKPVGHDRLTNVSILQLVDPPAHFALILVDPNVSRPHMGGLAVAISCPLDFQPSPSLGIFAGMDKRVGNKVFPTEYIRTTIPVDAGQGGCPILDINGRFVGISVASIPELNGSYCLPADALARVRDDLIFSGQIIHSWMGFEVAERLSADGSHAVYLSKVVAESPAFLAGLQQGDHLISIQQRAIHAVSDVPSAIFFTRANQFVLVQVRRGAELMDFSFKTMSRPASASKLASAVKAAPVVEPDLKPAD